MQSDRQVVGPISRVLAGLLAALVVLPFLYYMEGASARSVEQVNRSQTRFCDARPLPAGQDFPAFRVRLGTSANTVPRGGKLEIRIENLGTRTVEHGLGYRLARFRNGVWVNVPVGPFFQPIVSVPPRSIGPCQQVRITGDAIVGKYRILKDVELLEGKGRGTGRVKTARAFFQVIGT